MSGELVFAALRRGPGGPAEFCYSGWRTGAPNFDDFAVVGLFLAMVRILRIVPILLILMFLKFFGFCRIW